MNIILILIASVILPFVAEMIGIIANIKYPKLDADNDTEVVKQSMSSMISVFAGMGMLALTGFVLFKAVEAKLSPIIILAGGVVTYAVVLLILLWYLSYKSVKEFEKIQL